MALRVVKKKESYNDRIHRETLERFGSYDAKSMLLSQWMNLRVYHPKWGPVLVTEIINSVDCVVDVLSEDLRETIHKKRVYLHELKRDFDQFDRISFATRTFIKILRTPLSIHNN